MLFISNTRAEEPIKNLCDTEKVIVSSSVLKVLNERVGEKDWTSAKVKSIYQSSYSDFVQNSDGSVTCAAGVTLLMEDVTTTGGSVKVFFQNKSDFFNRPNSPDEVFFKSDDEIRREKMKEQAMAERSIKEDNIKKGFDPMSVSDFDLDKREILSDKKILIRGIFWNKNGIDVLTDQQPIPNYNENQPAINLLIEDAPRKTRAYLQRCRSSLIGWCEITLIGHEENCQIRVIGQLLKNDICLSVDGSR